MKFNETDGVPWLYSLKEGSQLNGNGLHMDVSIIYGCQNDFHMDLETDLLWENVWDPHRSSVF